MPMLRVFEQILGCEAYFNNTEKGLQLAKKLLYDRARKIKEYRMGDSRLGDESREQNLRDDLSSLTIERVSHKQIYDYQEDQKRVYPFEVVYYYGQDEDEDDDDDDNDDDASDTE